eukprot:2046568-Amphidinium_carterae.3
MVGDARTEAAIAKVFVYHTIKLENCAPKAWQNLIRQRLHECISAFSAGGACCHRLQCIFLTRLSDSHEEHMRRQLLQYMRSRVCKAL